MKYLFLAALLALSGCAGMGPSERRVVTVIGVIAGVALVASASKDDDDPAPAQQCTTVIRPNPGGGLGTNVRIC